MAQVVDDRGDDGKHDAFLDPKDHDRGGREQGNGELVAPAGQDAPHPADVDELDGDEEDDRRQGGVRQVGQRPGEQEQDDQDDRGGRELGQLAAPARAVDHLGLGRAAVDDEGAGERGGHVGGAQADQVGVLAERLLVLRGVGARGRRALGEDDDEHRRRGAEQRGGVVPAERGQPEVRQPARDGAEHGHAVPGQVRGPAHDDRGDHRDQRPGNLAVDPAGGQHDHDDPGRHRQISPRAPAGARAAMSRSLVRVLLPGGSHPEHVGELAGSHLDTDAGEESDQDGAGQEIRQEPEPGQPGQQQQPAGEQGREPGQPDVSAADPATASPVSAAARMAAVAESAPTTRWRDEPRTANTAIGSSIVYRPVTTGIPAIFAYPRTSGMPRAASVMPASTSAGTWDRSMGSSPLHHGQRPQPSPPVATARSRHRLAPARFPAVSDSSIIPPAGRFIALPRPRVSARPGLGFRPTAPARPRVPAPGWVRGHLHVRRPALAGLPRHQTGAGAEPASRDGYARSSMMTCTCWPLANGSAARRTSVDRAHRDAVTPDHVHLDIALADDHAGDTPTGHVRADAARASSGQGRYPWGGRPPPQPPHPPSSAPARCLARRSERDLPGVAGSSACAPSRGPRARFTPELGIVQRGDRRLLNTVATFPQLGPSHS